MTHARHPPGPPENIPLIAVRRKPLAFLARLVHDYGNIVRYVCDGHPSVLISTPEGVHHVLHTRAANYRKLGTPDVFLLRPMLGDGLLTTDGERWKRDRQRVRPLFGQLEVLRAAETIVSVTEGMLARWAARSEQATPFNLVPEMSRLTLEIVSRVLLSSDLSAQSSDFCAAVEVLNETMGDANARSPLFQERFRTSLSLVRRTLWQTVITRRFHDSGESDLIAVLLRGQRESGQPDQHIADQIVTLLLAGQETTAKALSWVFGMLDRNPAAALRLGEELALLGSRAVTSDDLPALSWTEAVVYETLRLYPPTWTLTRAAVADDEVAGYAIPAGTFVTISPYLLHRDPELWDYPNRFAPERFLDGRHEEAARQARYLPFGHGPRHCIGKHLALLEMKLVLATVHRQWSVKVTAGHLLEPEALVTLRPHKGLPVVATQREGRQ